MRQISLWTKPRCADALISQRSATSSDGISDEIEKVLHANVPSHDDGNTQIYARRRIRCLCRRMVLHMCSLAMSSVWMPVCIAMKLWSRRITMRSMDGALKSACGWRCRAHVDGHDEPQTSTKQVAHHHASNAFIIHDTKVIEVAAANQWCVDQHACDCGDAQLAMAGFLSAIMTRVQLCYCCCCCRCCCHCCCCYCCRCLLPRVKANYSHWINLESFETR